MRDGEFREIYIALLDGVSARNGRPMDWPRPGHLKRKAGLDAALEQDRCGFVAGRKFAAFRLSAPQKWAANPFRDKNWIVRWMSLQAMDPYFYAYDQTGDSLWLQRAAALMLDWAEFHVRDCKSAFMSWADMACGYRAIKLSRLLHHLIEGHLQLSEVDGELLIAAAAAHIAELSRPSSLSHGNHGIFQMHGLAMLSEMIPALPEALAAQVYSAASMSMLLHKQFNNEGMHLEHSPLYHFWMRTQLKAMMDSGWHRNPDFDVLNKKAIEAGEWLVYPNGCLVSVGDTTGSAPSYGNREPAVHTHRSDRYAVRCFDAGYAVCRSLPANDAGGSMLFLQAAYHSKAHKHADHLHIDLYDRGRPLLVDTGSIGYRGGPQRNFCLSSRAHNTVEFDGINHERDGSDAFGSALQRLEVFEDGIRIHASVHHAKHGVRHERVVEFVPGNSLTVIDRLTSEVERTFTQWFHLAPGLTLAASDGDGLRARDEVSGRQWLLRQLQAVDSIEHAFGSTEPLLQGWCAIGADSLTPRHTVGFRRKGLEVVFRFELSDDVLSGGRCDLAGMPLAVYLPQWDRSGAAQRDRNAG